MSNCWKNRTDYNKYQQKRAQMLADNSRDNEGKCTIQIDGVCTGKATTAHHIYGVCNGMLGPIVPACSACNYRLGDVSTNKDPAMRKPVW